MRSVFIPIALLLATACFASEQTYGIQGSLNLAIADSIRDTYITMINQAISNMSVPEITFDQGYLKDNSISIDDNANNI
jgi:hypothetical protein